jgi:hypothetical protein
VPVSRGQLASGEPRKVRTANRSCIGHWGTFLAEHSDVDGRLLLAGFAASWLAYLLAERGDLDEATHIMRARADSDVQAGALRLAGLLAETGDLDEAA